MKKKNLLNVIAVLLMLIILVGGSYAFFMYMRTSNQISKFVTGDIYMHYVENNELELLKAFPQTKEEGIQNDYFEFTVSGKNTTKNKDIYYAISLAYSDNLDGMNRYHDEDIVFYLTEVIDNEEVVLIDSVQYKSFNNAKIYVATIPKETNDEMEHTYRLRMWIDEDVLISDTDSEANYTTGEYYNSYTSVQVNVEGNLQENDINMILDANDDNYVNGKRAIYVDTYGYNDDNLVLEVTSDNENIEFLYVDEYENSIEESVTKLELNYKTNKKDVITIRVIPVSKNDTNTKTKLLFKLTRNGEIVEQQVKSLTVYGNNFCLNNGFNKLYDCILASENMSSNVEFAKTFIANKGEPNLNDTAPSYTYVEDITYDVENVYSYSGFEFYFGDSYEFNSTTGTFRIYNSDGSDIITDYLSDTYKSYYTCGTIEESFRTCPIIYRVDSTSLSGTTYTITQGDVITYQVASSVKSEVGLYKTEDDYGDAYFYRGDVNNNNVLFGGYYWKIIRTNGDNSIRLIYNGTTTDATGTATAINNTTYTYSQNFGDGAGVRYTDPTFVGYMYGKKFALQTSDITFYYDFTQLSKYYFADGYEFDEENEVFKLKKVNLEPLSGTFMEMKDSYTTYPYTCKSANIDGVCQVLLKVDSWVNETTVKVQYVSYSSVDKDGTRTNELSSNAKMQLENWYETNIIGKKDTDGNLITNYIVDATFCNDRSTSQSGYLLASTTYYGAYVRLTAINPISNLTCSTDIRDKFSSTTSRGNGLLEYPVALITVDEVVMAGGKYNIKNKSYYLSTDVSYWTMSPARFLGSYVSARIFAIRSDGAPVDLYYDLASELSLRPVINISKDVLISSGDGTIENPYQLSIQ